MIPHTGSPKRVQKVRAIRTVLLDGILTLARILVEEMEIRSSLVRSSYQYATFERTIRSVLRTIQ